MITKNNTINKNDIPNYVKDVVKKLSNLGFEAYIVGGSIRDLLLNKNPKDFDIATNATPLELKKIFRNARVIGRRFKLVHLLFHNDIIEVATFRTQGSDLEHHPDTGMILRDNAYGTIEDDAWRRDFTINSLYYDLNTEKIIDFTGGIADLEQKSLKVIGEPLIRYQEDPVRMLRALRFLAKLGLTLEKNTAKAIKEHANLIEQISNARLFDECLKLFLHGYGSKTYTLLHEFNIFQYLFPQAYALIQNTKIQKFIELAVSNTDNRVNVKKPINPAFLFSVILWFPLLQNKIFFLAQGLPNSEALEKAINKTLLEQIKIISIPRRFTMTIREIWLLQFRFQNRRGKKPYALLAHPKFRAAYDFLLLRAEVNDTSIELCAWWTKFQEVDDKQKALMVKQETTKAGKKK